MVCTLCGDAGHNSRTCPLTDQDNTGRGKRDSPRTPADPEKLQKLWEISTKLSPKAEVPPLPGQGSAQGSAGDNSSSGPRPEEPGKIAELESGGNRAGLDDSAEPSNADIMARLDMMMKSMVVKSDLDVLRSDIRKETKVTVSEAVDPLKSELADLKNDVEHSKAEAKQWRKSLEAEAVKKSDLKGDIQTMVEEIIDKQLLRGSLSSNGQSSQVLIGGLQNATRQEAEDWFNRKVQALKLEAPIDIFHKGDEFKGILYANFATPASVEKVTKAFAKDKPKLSGQDVWCKKDLPIERRVPLSFLLSLRWQLNQWGFTKQEVKVTEEDLTLTVGAVPVVKAAVSENKLKVAWIDKGWENWGDLQSAAELNKLTQAADEKLAKTVSSRAKGKGKRGCSSF